MFQTVCKGKKKETFSCECAKQSYCRFIFVLYQYIFQAWQHPSTTSKREERDGEAAGMFFVKMCVCVQRESALGG